MNRIYVRVKSDAVGISLLEKVKAAVLGLSIAMIMVAFIGGIVIKFDIDLNGRAEAAAPVKEAANITGR